MNIKRELFILKCRAYIMLRHLAEKVLLQLSKWGWIRCHKKSYSNTSDNSVVHSLPDLKSNRFVFSVSYILLKVERKYEYWFETKKGKRIFTVDESHHVEHRVSYRADLKAFFAHFSPKQRMWVYRNSPVVEILEVDSFLELPFFTEPVKVKTHRCDFSQCRFAFDFAFAPELSHNGMTSEVISQSYRALEVQLTSKVLEINKILTGADYDGEMMSPKKMPLSNNLLCQKCGLPVFASAENKYQFECLRHGELDHSGVMKVDPVEYQQVLGYTSDVLEDLIHKSCPQD